MSFTPAQAREILDRLYAQMANTLKARSKKAPAQTLDALHDQITLAETVLSNTDHRKKTSKKKGGKKRKAADEDVTAVEADPVC